MKQQHIQLPNLSKLQNLPSSDRSPRTANTPTRKASEVLVKFNFHLNPSLHKKKQIKNTPNNEFQTKKISKVTRNIMELRRRKKMKCDSLQIKPRIQACKTNKGGTISVLKNNEQCRSYLHKKYKDQIYTGASEFSDKSKDKLRLQMVKWLIDNKKEVVCALNENKQNILEWVQCVEKVDRDEFDIILHGIQLYKDPNLINRLFWVFDLNDDGYIEFNEIQYSINLFREYDQQDKIQIFFELCDENDDGYINEEDIKKFFSKNLTNQEEIRQMKFLMKDFYQELNPHYLKGLNADDLYQATLSDQNIRIIVEKNTLILKSNNKKEDDIGSSLNNLIYSGQYEGKQGIFFPQIEGLIDALIEKDRIMMQYKQIKLDFDQIEDNSD
ncbi:unnamed protein product [Paramecium pentaurelia]|uniref:EF-hand domain-containing protein n=1 Tax=Paramecium pentaurelia TaxID=43138 RepID=A0A8S1TF82_9CILI|nr:unnamed protein product [Paramecium pentaurelia]